MKKKLLLFFATAAALCLAILATHYSGSRAERYHQHREMPLPAAPCTRAGEGLCTALPLLEIDTGGQQVPGVERDGATITVGLRLIGQEGAWHHPGDAPTLSTPARIRYRGNTSMRFDKKSYLVKLTDGAGAPNPQALLGMPKEEEWVLNGPFLDKTLLRNYMIMNISAEIMGDAPEVRLCELVLDGAYQGVYLLMESVSRSRVGIQKAVEGRDEVSYIVRLDRGGPQDVELQTFSRYARRTDSIFNVVYPAGEKCTPGRLRYIEQDLSRFEKALYSLDYDDPLLGYPHHVDIPSFVDYMVINEFFQNYDAAHFSTYLSKEVGGKLAIGPVWDFNNAMDNYQQQDFDATGFQFQSHVWYTMLLKDERFTERVIRRYRALRRGVLSERYLQDYLGEAVAFLGPAVGRNYEVWGYSLAPEYELLYPPGRDLHSYEEAVAQARQFLSRRGAWLDKNIELLRQFSHPSKVKKYQH